jgi:hypothetical protein
MKSPERPDLLLDNTVDEITGVFDVEHVFPEVFLREEKHESMGMWARVKAFFGLGKRAAKKVPDQPGAGLPGS